MAQIDGVRKYGDSPKTPTSPTMEQLLHGTAGESSMRSPATSPTLAKDHDPEEDHTHLHKKSVLTKVKEKAKKLRHSLSNKKKHGHDSNATPSWGVSLDEDDGDEDPEYLGAPMYESELAPEGYKETARLHPRAVPMLSEKYVLAKQGIEQGKDEKPLSPNTTSSKHNIDQGKENPPSPNKTLTETVAEKLAPAYSTVSEATHTIASKIQGLTISNPTEPGTGEAAAAANSGKQKWDKGVSVKEYLMHKFEPGEDERALSQSITEAISPRKAPPGDMGMVEKVKGAVSSLFRTEDSTPSTNTTTISNSPSHIPISTNPHEVTEEETHGRILQAN